MINNNTNLVHFHSFLSSIGKNILVAFKNSKIFEALPFCDWLAGLYNFSSLMLAAWICSMLIFNDSVYGEESDLKRRKADSEVEKAKTLKDQQEEKQVNKNFSWGGLS